MPPSCKYWVQGHRQGNCRKKDERNQVDLFATEVIAQVAHQRHHARNRNQINRNSPCCPEDIGVKFYKVGEGHSHRCTINGVHQEAQPDRGKNESTDASQEQSLKLNDVEELFRL